MQVETWQGEEVFSSFEGCENLRDIITQIEKKHEENGKLLCEIRINGMLLEEDDEARFAETPLGDIKEISISLGSLKEILEDVQKAFKECIPSLQETSLRASEYFRTSDLVKAQNTFSALLEGCQWLVDTLVHVRKTSGSNKSSVFKEDDWKELEKNFSQSIRQVLVSFQQRDYALLADLLEYEMTTVLDSWLELLQLPSQELSSESAEGEGAQAEEVEKEISADAALNYEPVERIQNTVGGR